MKQHIETLIRALEAEQQSISKKLTLAYRLRDSDQPQGNNHRTPKAHRGAGYVNLVLPFLQQQGQAHVDVLYKHLKEQPGMKNVDKASFVSTLHSEAKKAKPRLVKTGPGIYAALAGGQSNEAA